MCIVPVKPTFADGCIGFSLLIMKIFSFIQFVTSTQYGICHIGKLRHGSRICRIRNYIPFGRSCSSGFVTTPAHIFATENNGIRSQLMNQFFPGRIVVGLSAFPLRMGTIEPDFVYRTIFCQDLKQLVQEIFIVIIHYKFKFRLISERPAGNFARDGPFSIFT